MNIKSLRGTLFAFLFGGILLTGCASEPSYRQAFDSSQQISGNTETISASLDRTWAASLRVLSQQGFMVRSADKANSIVLADREMTDQNDKNVSYQITSTVTFVSLGQGITQVSIAANQTTELHRKEYVWWHLLWLIPLFPIGSEYTAVVTQRGTVQNPEFYAGFFDNLKKLVQANPAVGLKK
jgi:outer membrane murein-binding lipoprotein Lpp